MKHLLRDLGDLSGLDISMVGLLPVDRAPISRDGPAERPGTATRPAALREKVARWMGIGLARDGRCRGDAVMRRVAPDPAGHPAA